MYNAFLERQLLNKKLNPRSRFYTVGPEQEFKTIQDAIDCANLNGGGTIYLEPMNDYYENLVLHPGITIEGCGIADLKFVKIYGQHRLPEMGEIGFNHILFCNETSIFEEPIHMGDPNLLFRSCVFEVSNGYILNIPNMNGSVIFFDCCSTGENNGFINNSNGKCVPTIFNITIDGGKRNNKMYLNSDGLFFNVHFKIKMEFSGENGIITINGGSWLEDTALIRGTSTVKIANSNIETEESSAFFIDKDCLLTLDNCSVDSTSQTVIEGSGIVRLGNVCFPNCSNISPSIQVQSASTIYRTTTIVGIKGEAQPLPVAPQGYFVTSINGKEFLVPYYSMPSQNH